jgi:UDP-2,4-diacetamido-2,4,6-trideoxy-beta-L-altropyranose hydrolase
VVDHYALDAAWEAGMRDRAPKILVIDDLADRRHVADVLLDQNFGGSASAYRDLVPGECVLLIGSNYALLRPEFAALRARSLARRAKAAERHTLLISFGGFDPDNLTALAIEGLSTLDSSRIERITVLLSKQAPHFSRVVSVAEESGLPIDVMPYTTRIAEFMCAADLAIGGAGTTSWERCTLGVPSVLVVLADNQLRAALALQQAGAGLLAGRSLDVTAEKLGQCVRSLLTDEMALRSMAEQAATICDGLGVERVVGALA